MYIYHCCKARRSATYTYGIRSVQLRIADILLASERSERDSLRSVQLRIADILYVYVIARAGVYVLINRKEGGA